MKAVICILTLLVGMTLQMPAVQAGMDEVQPPIEPGEIKKELLPIAYSGREKLKYAISWTGGVKLGELHLEIRKTLRQSNQFELHALVTTKGSFFDKIYPVRDIYLTTVVGNERLPSTYEVWQKEGYNYEAHRKTNYDQQAGLITYRKNEEPNVEYTIAGEVHNEFSAFFGSRLMDLSVGKSFTVPTFADKKKVDVLVQVTGKRFIGDTPIGPVDTVEVSPILNFKGLYDKSGDTVIWYTADECRVPVLVTSKIMIGSVTSTLIEYSNPDCARYADFQPST
jgi:hypothetical protein